LGVVSFQNGHVGDRLSGAKPASLTIGGVYAFAAYSEGFSLRGLFPGGRFNKVCRPMNSVSGAPLQERTGRCTPRRGRTASALGFFVCWGRPPPKCCGDILRVSASFRNRNS